jgi:hypothetical protein
MSGLNEGALGFRRMHHDHIDITVPGHAQGLAGSDRDHVYRVAGLLFERGQQRTQQPRVFRARGRGETNRALFRVGKPRLGKDCNGAQEQNGAKTAHRALLLSLVLLNATAILVPTVRLKKNTTATCVKSMLGAATRLTGVSI